MDQCWVEVDLTSTWPAHFFGGQLQELNGRHGWKSYLQKLCCTALNWGQTFQMKFNKSTTVTANSPVGDWHKTCMVGGIIWLKCCCFWAGVCICVGVCVRERKWFEDSPALDCKFLELQNYTSQNPAPDMDCGNFLKLCFTSRKTALYVPTLYGT